MEFLKANDKLLLDTCFFDEDLKWRLLAGIDNLDQQSNGLLIHGENFQALNLGMARYREQVKCIYIDPPYNTSSSAIPYKNNYKHSSWGTMMRDRLEELRKFLQPDGAIFVSIDKTERTILEHVMDSVFGQENRIEELIWTMNTTNSQLPNYSTNHEYVLVYAHDRSIAEQQAEMFREPKPGYEEVMTLIARLNAEYPPIKEIEREIRDLYTQHKIEYRESVEAAGLEWADEKGNDPWKGLFNYSHAEYRDSSGNPVAESEARKKKAVIWVWQEGDASMPASKQAASTHDPEHPNWRFYKPIHPITGKEAPHPKSGWKFANDLDNESPDRRSFVSLDRDGRIAWGPDEKKVPRVKRMLHEVETNIGKSVFQDYSDGEKQTSAMFGESGLFLAPKHSGFVSRFILHAGKEALTVIDCFGGSGSTGHAVIDLNRVDRMDRKYVQVEVNQCFYTLLKPRILKAVYSSRWKGGKPISRDSISHCIKYIRLESYEDALNNLELKRTSQQASLLEQDDDLREQYVLSYMLDVESRGSQSLLNVESFRNPDQYKLRVERNGETQLINVDLVETFNWLLGLTVKRITFPQRFHAEFVRKELPSDNTKKCPPSGKLKVRDRLRPSDNGPFVFRTVEGTSPNGESVLVVWRHLTDNLEEANTVLDFWFDRRQYNTKDQEYDLIYVNGDNNLENLRRGDQTWKVRLIEEEFQRLMFDVQDI